MMEHDADFFAGTPGHLLRRCHQIAVALFHDECEKFDLTPLQFAILSALDRDGEQDQITLGGATAIDRTTVTVVIRNLEQRGFLSRKKSPQDKRHNIVSLTEKGSEIVAAALPAVGNAQQRIVGPLEKDEAAELVRLLEKMTDANNDLSRAPVRSPPKS